MENREIDVGLAFYQTHFKNVISEEVFSEPMRILCPAQAELSGPIHPQDLDPENEIYVYWCPDYLRWHDAWWESKAARTRKQTQPTWFLHSWTIQSNGWLPPYQSPKVFTMRLMEESGYMSWKSHHLTESAIKCCTNTPNPAVSKALKFFRMNWNCFAIICPGNLRYNYHSTKPLF